MHKRWLIVVLVLLSGFNLVTAENIPQPEGWVNDFAGVISAQYRNKLTALIQETEEKTSAEIAVVTVTSIAPYDETSFARMLFDNWKPGKKGKDNGVLVFLAIKERRWRIETGYGVEGILPDGLCGEIGRNYMVPYFKEGKYSEGLFAGVLQISRIISGDINAKIVKRTESGNNAFGDVQGLLLFSLFLLILGIIIVLNITKNTTYYGGGYRGGYDSGSSSGWGGGGFGGGGFGGGGGGGGGAGGGF